METVLNILETETNGTCYTLNRYCVDDELNSSSIAYDELQKMSLLHDRFGETDTTLNTTKDISGLTRKTNNDEPLFRFFLDGSRRTYKVDDIEINRRIYPIVAGQIGVACCERKTPSQFKCAELEHTLVLSLPTVANPHGKNSEQFFSLLTSKINKTKRIQSTYAQFSKILTYRSDVQKDPKEYENLGIATIQDEMVEAEKNIVAHLHTKNLLNQNSYLIKDGSLQYTPIKSGDYKELAKYKNHYRCVIGVSKMFNPDLCRDRKDKSNADKIAKLKVGHRTPAYMYKSDMVGNVNFAIWYVRIRDAKHTDTAMSGIVKIEKILITDDENTNGLDSDEVDLITANIINERNPVCYGRDSRWANHLYPVYLTESYIKSKYLSDIHFLNLF